MSIPTLVFFWLVGHAAAGTMGTPTAVVTGKVIGKKPTSIKLGGTAVTEVAATGTVTFTPTGVIFASGQATVAVTIVGGTGSCTAGDHGATSSVTNPVLTVTLPAGCSIAASGEFTVEITDATKIVANPATAYTVAVTSTTDTVAGTTSSITPVAGITSPSAVPTCLSQGDVPEIAFTATTANDPGAALAAASTIEVTSDLKIFESGKTLTASDLSLSTAFTQCTAVGVTDTSSPPKLTVTLSSAASTCAVAVATAFTLTVKNGVETPSESMANTNILAAAPTAAVIVSIKGAGTTVVAATAYTPLATAPLESSVVVQSQLNAVKPTSIIFGFKNAASALAAAGTIEVATKDPSDNAAVVMLTASLSAQAATIKAGSSIATLAATTKCSATFATDASSVMTLTLADSSATCAIAASNYVTIEVSTAASIAVNPTAKGLGAAIKTAAGASCLPYKYLRTGTGVTLPTMTHTAAGPWAGGATATTALAATNKIYFMVKDDFFKVQAAATAVTIGGAGSTACSGTATTTADTMTVTLASSTTTCAIAAAGLFTVAATEANFQATRPTADATRQGWVWTSQDLAAEIGTTAIGTGTVNFVHKATVVATVVANLTNASSNSTTVGQLITGTIHLQAPTSIIAMMMIFLTTAVM